MGSTSGTRPAFEREGYETLPLPVVVQPTNNGPVAMCFADADGSFSHEAWVLGKLTAKEKHGDTKIK